MWHFVLSRSDLNNEILFDWIESLQSKSLVDKLLSQGWYLPFKNDYIQSKYKFEKGKISGPTQRCWANSWSFPILTNSQKKNFEDYWNKI